MFLQMCSCHTRVSQREGGEDPSQPMACAKQFFNRPATTSYSVKTAPGLFGLLPLKIQEEILLSLPAKDLAPVELTSSHFRALVLDGELWRRKAEIVGKEIIAVMNKEIVEEKRCMWPMHDDVARIYDAKKGSKAFRMLLEEYWSDDEDESSEESDVELENISERFCDESDDEKEKSSEERDVEAEAKSIEMKGEGGDDYEDYDLNNEDPKETKAGDNIVNLGKLPEKEDLSTLLVHCRFRVCNVCLLFDAFQNRNYRNCIDHYKCPGCRQETVFWDWCNVEDEINFKLMSKGELEKLLAKPVGTGKEKMKAVLEFLRETSYLPVLYWDIVSEEGGPEYVSDSEKDSGSEDFDNEDLVLDSEKDSDSDWECVTDSDSGKKWKKWDWNNWRWMNSEY